MKSNILLTPASRGVRQAFRDHSMLTFDSSRPTMDAGVPVHPGKGLSYGMGGGGRPGIQTHDGKWVDSTGAFFVGELERLDLTMNTPLAEVSWGRDIDLRDDVTIADEITSFTLSTFASAGTLGTGNGIGNGKAWMGKTSDQIGGVNVDIAKPTFPLTLWGLELKYTIPELESAAKVGRPIDQQKYAALQLKHQMDIDEQVYIGDSALGQKGMLNNASVTPANVANGASGSPLWASKTPAEILQDVNTALTSVWTTAALAVMPDTLLLPPLQFGFISTQLVSLAGSISILAYLKKNNIRTQSGNGDLRILPAKWAVGAGAGGTIGTNNGHNRMMVYTKEKKYIRYPMTPLQRTPIQYDSIYHKTTYFCRLGVVELVYPETVGYFDGIG